MAEAFRELQAKKDDHSPSQYNQAIENSIQRPPLGYVVHSHDIKLDFRFKEDTKTYRPIRACLENALSKPVFCCGGSLRPPNIEKFEMKVKPMPADEQWKEFKLANLSLDELIKYCNPAPFGDLEAMQTVLDSEVRLAHELEPEKFTIEREHIFMTGSRIIADFPGSKSIEKCIEDTLAPGRYVRLDRHKLNIYSEGGFFKPHVDSPSCEEMIGTLVLCLPSPHKGGELCVSHDGLQHVFDFSQESNDPNRIQWAAFYSDCIHEVKPVLDGKRVTVTYKITVVNHTDWYSICEKRSDHGFQHIGASNDGEETLEERFEASVDSPSLATKALTDVNNELDKIFTQGKSSPSRVGFLLKHKYVVKGLQPHLLKGEDKVLFDFLVEKQWQCKLTSVLSRFQTSTISPYGPFEDQELVESHEVFEFNPSLTTPFTPNGNVPRRENWPRGVRRECRKWRVGIPFIGTYRKAEDNEQVMRNNKGHGSWIGNEVRDVGVDRIYLESAIIINGTSVR